jgi:predicted ATP-grasp superfamily ATP-dependent carboligase
VPLVADLFRDLDTREIAAESIRVAGSLERGLAQTSLLDALGRLADGRRIEGLVYGSGFEDRPMLLAAIARRYRLIGTSPEIIARVKHPFTFAELCRGARVPHPETRRTGAGRGEWLQKQIGAAGGAHVRPAVGRRPRRSRTYFQRRAGGRAVSALFLAGGKRTLMLGFSEQWADPAPGRPFRYGGAVQPAAVPAAQLKNMARAVERLAPGSGVVGLCSADFLLRPNGFDLLEINPRPGATLDIFRDAEGRLFHLHLEACRGRLPQRGPTFVGAAAAAVVYAPTTIRVPADFAWPDWTADRQPSDEEVPGGAPLCTVIAEAQTACLARRLAGERASELLIMTAART